MGVRGSSQNDDSEDVKLYLCASDCGGHTGRCTPGLCRQAKASKQAVQALTWPELSEVGRRFFTADRQSMVWMKRIFFRRGYLPSMPPSPYSPCPYTLLSG